MDVDRWKLIDGLVDAALDLPETERERFVSERSGEDEKLKKEVLDLLNAQKEADGFLQNSAMNLMAKAVAEDQTNAFDNSLYNKTLGNYKIEKILGAGGMGEVYLAHDQKLNRKVALKILPKEFLADDERVKRFEIEARAIAVLNHPNIVTIYDFGNLEGVNYIATEFVEGQTVRDLIGPNFTLKETLSIILQAADALSAAHSAGIVHRDIKPENIMVRPDGYVKILDFGLAKLTEEKQFSSGTFTETLKGAVIGTPAYMSPEQASGDKIDNRTDLWSIGLVLYEMLTGQNPFKKENRQATIQAVLTKEPPLVSELKSSLPTELDQILVKALEKDADLSYQTASDFRADLKRIKREIDSSPSWSSSSGSRQSVLKRKQKSYASFYLSGVILVLLGASVLFYFWRGRPQITGLDWTKANNLQLTEQTGVEYFPSLAPDGKSFVFASEAKGNFDIYWQRVGGKNPTNLTPDSLQADTQPAFSPDGNRIVFRSEREPPGIYLIEATGENLRRVADFGFHPSWSPDGKEIVVSTFGLDAPTVRIGHDNSLWIINVETGAKRELLKQEASFPTWSPHGRRIAFWFYPAALGRRDIATISADGRGEPVVITKDFSVSNWNPVWSPDGKFLYFVSDKNGNWNFWRVAINETTGEALADPEPVLTPSSYSRHLSFSADGKRMIYVQSLTQGNIQGVDFDDQTLKTSGAPFWITSGDRELTRAELSADGKRFLTRQIRRTQDDIVVVNRDGTGWHDVTNDLSYDRYPRWSPDGSQIAFASDRGGGYEIWICNVDGTNLHQITFNNDPVFGSSFPTWAPDGNRLIYSFQNQTYIFDLSKRWDEQPREKLPLNPKGASLITWDWSPDGKKLVGFFYGKEIGVGTYSFETNNFAKFSNDNETIPSWLPDSRHIIFTEGHKILIADTETKIVKEILTIEPEMPRAPFVSRDGKLLYFTAQISESDIWLLDNSQSP